MTLGPLAMIYQPELTPMDELICSQWSTVASIDPCFRTTCISINVLWQPSQKEKETKVNQILITHRKRFPVSVHSYMRSLERIDIGLYKEFCHPYALERTWDKRLLQNLALFASRQEEDRCDEMLVNEIHET